MCTGPLPRTACRWALSANRAVTVTVRAKHAPDAADLGRTIAADPALGDYLTTLELPAALDELLFSPAG